MQLVLRVRRKVAGRPLHGLRFVRPLDAVVEVYASQLRLPPYATGEVVDRITEVGVHRLHVEVREADHAADPRQRLSSCCGVDDISFVRPGVKQGERTQDLAVPKAEPGDAVSAE